MPRIIGEVSMSEVMSKRNVFLLGLVIGIWGMRIATWVA